MLHNLGTLVQLLEVFAWRSLGIGATTIAVSAMWFRHFDTTCVILYATICSMSDLCVMKCRCLLDLLLDEVECVHCRSPKRMGFSPRSFSRLRPNDNEVQIPLRSLPVLLPLLVVIQNYFCWYSSLEFQHPDMSYSNIKVIQTWDERSVPRLTCVLDQRLFTLTFYFRSKITQKIILWSTIQVVIHKDFNSSL